MIVFIPGFWVVFLKQHMTNIRRKFKQKKVGNSRWKLIKFKKNDKKK